MRQKFGVITTCVALLVSVAAPTLGVADVHGPGKGLTKCQKLLKRYHNAVDKGDKKRIKKLETTISEQGC